ncbi:MAG: pantoate--beta-alanine ligase [Phycisphaerales bacterium]
MRIVRRSEELEAYRGAVLVPTMGALHAGHAALIGRARSIADERSARLGIRQPVLVSVFVNPTQFDEGADFDSYPRTLDADGEVAQRAGADAVFAPPASVVYPPDGSAASAARFVPREADLPSVARDPGLEDAQRPGHFAGVCGVVRRLFELTRASAAVFGEKDWQQFLVVRALTDQDRIPIEIIPHPTVRDGDGLALSSRNARLSAAERDRASAVPRALKAARGAATAEEGERAARGVLESAGLRVEYAAVRDAATLMPIAGGGAVSAARVLIAARLGGTRLIDNAAWSGCRDGGGDGRGGVGV